MQLFDRMRARIRPTWTFATFAFVYAAHLTRFISWVPGNYFPGGDGYYIYILARSLAFDGDLDLTNDYTVCGDQWRYGYDHGTGLPGNPYYIGATTIWTPVLYLIRLAARFGPEVPERIRMGCEGPIPYALGVTLAPIFATLTTYLGFRIALRFVGRAPALIAVLVIGLGSGLNTFGPLWWNYSHVWAAAIVTGMGLCALRVLERPASFLRWFVLGVFVGWSYLMRPHHGVWIAMPFAMTVAAMIAAIRERRLPFREALRGLVCLAGFALVGSLRAFTYHVLYGEYFPNLAGTVYVQPLHAHPFLVLFSARAGLLYQTPLMWLGILGIPIGLAHRPASAWTKTILVGLLIDFWICSSPLSWTGGATVGPRLLVSFTGLLLPFVGLSLERIWAWVNRSRQRLARVAVVGWVVPALAFSWQLIFGDPPYTMTDVYGGALRRNVANVDALVGNPFTLPATLVFAARYGTHPRNFDVVAVDGHFRHTYDTGLVEPNGTDRISLEHPPGDVLFVDGRAPGAGGLRVDRRTHARFLLPLAWPTVTDVVLTVSSERRCSVRLVAGQFWYRTDLGRRPVPAGVWEVSFRATRGAFDSGINEVVIASACPVTVRSLRFVDSTEHDVRTDMMRRRGEYLIGRPARPSAGRGH